MSDPFIGEIRLFAGNFAPLGWAFCDGSTLDISQFDTLFSLIGTTYGGDGQNTFALPDLRGRVPMHMGTGAGLSSRVIGEMGGIETVSLTAQQMPVHSHTPLAVSANGNQATPQNGVWASTAASRYASGAPNLAMNPSLVSQCGESQPHDNLMPYVTISFIIALNGIYPSQN